METYIPSNDRYNKKMKYNYCGKSGLQIPQISLGLWHNFGDVDDFSTAASMIHYAFDHGVTHFDLANNYGPPAGSAESNFGKIFAADFKSYRDELIISSKAGHEMWQGPYGDGGSRKYIMSSLDQSLKRTGLDYFDIFYSHRYDSKTPLEETIQALIDIVKQGKALYVGISKYPPEMAKKAYEMMQSQHVPCLIYQGKYNMFYREPEQEILSLGESAGVGYIAFSPLAQGLLTNKYLKGIPSNSRAAKSTGFLKEEEVTTDLIAKSIKLNELAKQRDQSLAEMALAWVLKDTRVTSVIVGSSSIQQLHSNLKTLNNIHFSSEELELIENILK